MSENVKDVIDAEIIQPGGGAEEASSISKSPRKTQMPISKISLLLSLLALFSIGYLTYEGIEGPFGIKRQADINYKINLRLVTIEKENQQLQTQVKQLQTVQNILQDKLKDNSATQTNLIMYQLNALLGSANQSLILFHDYKAALNLLNYAKQILIASGNPIFTDIKISLAKDIDNLEAQDTFDNTMIAGQIDNLYQQSLNLKVSAPIATSSTDKNDRNIWQRFINNLKTTVLGLIKVQRTSQIGAEIIMPESESLLRQHLQIDILNARQGLITRNQHLWLVSLNDSKSLIQHYFIADQLSFQQLQVINQLLNIKFDSNQANLDLTMKSLIKLQKLYSN